MNYTHYILTRFNLALYTDNPYKIKDPDKWMVDRCELFEKFTLKTVQAQTVQNFKWILSFDELTPVKYLKRYDYIDNIEICFEQPHNYLKTKDIETSWLVTTRLDNDDSWHPDFIKIVQSQIAESTQIIDVDYLKVWNDKKKPSGRIRPNSPFLSFQTFR